MDELMSEAYEAIPYMVTEKAQGELQYENVSPTRFLKISNNYYYETHNAEATTGTKRASLIGNNFGTALSINVLPFSTKRLAQDHSSTCSASDSRDLYSENTIKQFESASSLKTSQNCPTSFMRTNPLSRVSSSSPSPSLRVTQTAVSIFYPEIDFHDKCESRTLSKDSKPSYKNY